jgi:hypothetical protein
MTMMTTTVMMVVVIMMMITTTYGDENDRNEANQQKEQNSDNFEYTDELLLSSNVHLINTVQTEMHMTKPLISDHCLLRLRFYE